MPTPTDLAPLKDTAIKPDSSSGWMTAPRRRHPMSSLPSNTAPTDELIVARLYEGREQYEQGLEDLQNRQEEFVQRSRANDETLQGKFMALESQMAELRGKVERLQKMDCSPAMGVSERFAPTREEPDKIFEDSTAKLNPELHPSGYVIKQLNRRVAESQSEQAKQRVEVGLLQERNTMFLDLLKGKISQRETLIAAFREVQEKGCLKADDIYTVAAWLERKDEPRSNGMGSLSIGYLPTDGDEAMDLAIGKGQSCTKEHRRQGPSRLVVEPGWTSPNYQRAGETTDIATETLVSMAMGSSLPSNKRKRDGSEAGDEQDEPAVVHQRRRLDLNGRNVAPSQGPRAKSKTSLFSREAPPRELASNWRTHAPGSDEFERPIGRFTSGGALPSRSESKCVADEEMLFREVKFGNFPVVRIPASGPDLGFRNWKHSVLRKDR